MGDPVKLTTPQCRTLEAVAAGKWLKGAQLLFAPRLQEIGLIDAPCGLETYAFDHLFNLTDAGRRVLEEQ